VKALVQRVSRARVTVEGAATGEIGAGLVVLVGATHDDRAADAEWLAKRVAGLRVFADDAGRMNRDVRECGGAALVVPQFTLYGDARYGRRPEFTAAARHEQAAPLVDAFCAALASHGVRVERGVFRAHMEVELVNDGPVTLMIESVRGGRGASGARDGESPPPPDRGADS
jgi:D-aminoacyl-tRNA deacylase